ncbi:MAG: redox-regulated ATPase YchF [bacterium]
MGFTCGIVGLPNVGKSTLFNAITAAQAHVANYPFCTIDPNMGVVAVPDRRLERLTEIFKPATTIPTTIEFLDIAGLVKGASKGEGLGNQFLSHIRTVDAIAHIVRCFDDANVVHVDGSINPRRDIEVVETELILKDLETVEKKFSEAEKHVRTGEKKFKAEADFYTRVKHHLAEGRLARYLTVTHDEELPWLRDLHLLTNKPVLYVCNIHEQDIGKEIAPVQEVRTVAAKENAQVAIISAEVEAEIAQLPVEEREGFLEGLGLAESGLTRLIHNGYTLLQLITFFSVNPKELHAWTVRKGTHAPEAAGVIHTDFQKGFIKVEVMKQADLDRFGSEHALREHGLLHIHGKEYVIEDGDVTLFRFHV